MKVQITNLQRILCVLTLVLFLAPSTFGQVSKVKEESKKENSSSNSETSRSGGGSGGFFIDLFVDITFGLFVAIHADAMDKRYEIPNIVSLHPMIYGGYYQGYDAIFFAPRLQGNYGLFGFDARYQDIADNTGLLNTWDASFVLNLVNTQHAKFKWGNGVYYEEFNQQSFYQYMFGLDINNTERNVMGSLEYRRAIEFGDEGERNRIPYQEVNARIGYRIFNKQWIDANLFGGLMYQNYYKAVDFYFIQSGIQINIH